MSHQSDMQKLIDEHYRRLQKLKEQQARYGNSADPSITIEIEDVEKEIKRLQNELAYLNSYPSNTSPPVKQTDIETSKPSSRSVIFGRVGKIIVVMATIVPCVISLCALFGIGSVMDGFTDSSSQQSTPQEIVSQPTPMPTDRPANTNTPVLPSPTHTLTPLPTNTPVPIATLIAIPEPTIVPIELLRSCQEILENGQSYGDDYYTIDADGSSGRLEPFEVYCDMTREGGGWTLFAYHTDGIKVFEVANVTKTEPGVMQSERWRAVIDNMTTGMIFVDEFGRVSTLSAIKLNRANCQNVQNPERLVSTSGINLLIWHDEDTGCGVTGKDYSLIQILGPSYGNYKWAGASLTQWSAERFDIWPYKTDFSAYDQNELFYFIK